MIRRSFTHLDEKLLVQLFVGLIRPHLEYGNCVWNPIYKNDINRIEKIQRRATKMVPNLRDMPYEERLRVTKLPSLAYRRLRGDMIEVYKYLHNKYNVNSNQLLTQINNNSRTRGHSLKLDKRGCNSTLREHFFTMRVVNKWNSLPEEIGMVSTTNSFKNRLDRYWKTFQYS
jgi:ribonuclease P/MRP protein subunit RPP40